MGAPAQLLPLAPPCGDDIQRDEIFNVFLHFKDYGALDRHALHAAGVDAGQMLKACYEQGAGSLPREPSQTPLPKPE